jgi:hypothetical protein
MRSHLTTDLRGRVAALLSTLLLAATLLSSSSTAYADDAADRAFIQRLVARQVIAGVAVSGDTATIQALAPFAGADDGSMRDVARVVLRVHGAESPTVTKVVVRDPGGQVIATYTEATGLVRS